MRLASDSEVSAAGLSPRDWKRSTGIRFTFFQDEEDKVVNYDEFDIKKPLNDLISFTLENNKEAIAAELGSSESNIPPRKTAYFTYHRTSDKKAAFFDNLDAKFMNYTPRNMRRFQWWFDKSLQTVSGLFCGLGPMGVVPPIMAAGGIILDSFIPQNSGMGLEFAWTMAAFMMPSTISHGCKLARDLRDFAYPSGFEQNTEEDGKPQFFHINWKVRSWHRLVAGLTVALRAAPALTYLWVIEEKVSRKTHSSDGLYWAAGFSIPYFCCLAKSYSFSMDSQEQEYIRRKNNETKVAGIKRCLNHQSNTMEALVNGPDSDELALAVDKEFRRVLREKKLLREMEDILQNGENNDFCGGCCDIISKCFGSKKTIDKSMTEILFKYIKEEIKEIKENNVSSTFIKKMKGELSSDIALLLCRTREPLEINVSIQQMIENTILGHDLGIVIEDNMETKEKKEEMILSLIYKYITNRNLTEDQVLEEENTPLRKDILGFIETIFQNKIQTITSEYLDSALQNTCKIDLDVQRENIKNIFFDKNLNESYKEEKILELVYNYATNRIFKEDKNLEEIRKTISENIIPILRDDDYEERVTHLINETNSIQKISLGSVMEEGQGMAKSAVSLLFAKYIDPTDYNKKLDVLTERTQAMSFRSKNMDEGTELMQAVRDIKNSDLEGMRKRLYDEDNLPPEPSTMQWLARIIQGGAIAGRFSTALFPFKEILNRTALSWVGYGAALIGIPLGHIESRDILKDFYTNLFSRGKCSVSFLLSGLGKMMATVPSTASCLAQIGIIFEMEPTAPLYLKVILSVLLVQAEFPLEFTFHNTYWQEIITTIVICDLPKWAEDNLPPSLKAARARERLNQYFREVRKDINKFDAPSARTLYNRMTGIDLK